MPGAGRGVFVAGPEPVESGTALCLYPGVHTPPLPLSALRAATESGAMLLVLAPGYQQFPRIWGGFFEEEHAIARDCAFIVY